MVCQKCKELFFTNLGEKKLTTLACPEVWKTSNKKISKDRETNDRIVGNKLLDKKKAFFTPTGKSCKACKKNVGKDSIYCQNCSYSKGLCSMCGVKIFGTKFYRQTNV